VVVLSLGQYYTFQFGLLDRCDVILVLFTFYVLSSLYCILYNTVLYIIVLYIAVLFKAVQYTIKSFVWV